MFIVFHEWELLTCWPLPAANLVGNLVEACKKAVGVELVIHTKPKTEEGNAEMDAMLQAIKESDENPAILGIIARVSHCGPPKAVELRCIKKIIRQAFKIMEQIPKQAASTCLSP